MPRLLAGGLDPSWRLYDKRLTTWAGACTAHSSGRVSHWRHTHRRKTQIAQGASGLWRHNGNGLAGVGPWRQAWPALDRRGVGAPAARRVNLHCCAMSLHAWRASPHASLAPVVLRFGPMFGTCFGWIWLSSDCPLSRPARHKRMPPQSMRMPCGRGGTSADPIGQVPAHSGLRSVLHALAFVPCTPMPLRSRNLAMTHALGRYNRGGACEERGGWRGSASELESWMAHGPVCAPGPRPRTRLASAEQTPMQTGVLVPMRALPIASLVKRSRVRFPARSMPRFDRPRIRFVRW